ncbi:RDD family protein [Synechocystis sp. LKSZ1]|uniref:RDD family protein n=1 Tax=Synechocystis sp. LKSZ1 TaxID=3144951 RepID=UPI00336C1041
MALFNRYTLQTPESVELDFRLAGIGNRLYALLLDYLFLGVMIIALMLVWLICFFALEDWFSGIAGWELWLFAIQLLLLFALYVGYFVCFETLWQGQTPGKRWVKIRVIRDDGRPIGLAQATLRALLRPIDDLLYIGMFFIIFSRQEKRIGDWLAGTLVIEETTVPRRQQSPKLLATLERARPLAQRLQIHSNLGQLSPEQLAIVRQYLLNRREMLATARQNISQKLQTQVQEIIQFSQFSPDLAPDLFLEAVYLAYEDLPTPEPRLASPPPPALESPEDPLQF